MADPALVRQMKLRLGIWYDDPLKDEEIAGHIDAAYQDLTSAGASEAAVTSGLGLDTIERYLRGGQNDRIYLANLVKLAWRKEETP